MSFPFIDVHSHFVPPFYRDALREAGYLNEPNSVDICPEWSIENHASFMRTKNVRKSYLSLSAPGTFLQAPANSQDTSSLNAAKQLTRRINEFGISLRTENPMKFGFLASLPLPNVEATLEELSYLETSASINGFTVLSNTFGTYIGDESLKPVYEKLNDLKAIVLVHPNAAANPLPTRLQLAREQSTDLDFAFDSTLAFANLLLTNTAATYPHIKWIIPHCAFALPSILSRVINYSQRSSNPALSPLTDESIKALLRSSFYFDLAGIPTNHQINTVLKWVDLTRFVFGSDVPFTDWRLAGELGEQIREELLRLFGTETGVHECMRICYGNAERLFAAS